MIEREKKKKRKREDPWESKNENSLKKLYKEKNPKEKEKVVIYINEQLKKRVKRRSKKK